VSKALPSVPLPNLSGGVNRFSRDIQGVSHQCLDALDVIEDDGDVRRRDAFHAVSTGAPFYLPAGKTVIRHRNSDPAPAWDLFYDRKATLSFATASVGATPDYASPATGELWVMCEEKFDGIDWKHVTPPQYASASARLRVSYLNSTPSFVQLPSVLDSTEARMKDSSGNEYTQTLCRDGRISWHSSQISDWTALDVGGTLYYVVALHTDFGLGSITGSGAPASLVVSAPGPRPFLLAPVSSVMPYTTRRGRSFLLVGNDRHPARGKEHGSQLGSVQSDSGETQVLFLSDGTAARADEGSCLSETVTPPQWRKWTGTLLTDSSNPNTPQGSASFTVTGSAPSAVGSANVITRLVPPVDARLKVNNEIISKENYEWFEDQFRGGEVMPAVSPEVSPIVNDSTTQRGSFTIDVSGATFGAFVARYKDGDFEGHRLRCVVDAVVGGGEVSNLGQEREIYEATLASDVLTLKYHDEFHSTPQQADSFTVVRPHARMRFRNKPREYEVNSNTESTLTVTNINAASEGERPYEPLFEAGVRSGFFHFDIGRELRWTRKSGEFWSSTYDPVTQKLLLTNGESGILEYDGQVLRVLKATDDHTNQRVLEIIGALSGVDADGLSPAEIAGNKLRGTPPLGKFVVNFRDRIFVANTPEDQRQFQYSAPGLKYNDIWPYGYSDIIRDPYNDAISGMAVLGTNLFVFTPSAIHRSFDTGIQGKIGCTPVVMGLGFLSHRGVADFGGMLLAGPTADGVYGFDGQSIRPLLDSWERVLDGGVNSRRLSQSVSASSLHKTELFMAVPSAGSQVLDKILVFNWTTGKWWVWSAPWGGISSITRQTTPFGEERILFGTNDGHIAVLRSADTDDGDTITGRALSPLVQPALTATVAPTAITLMAEESGSSLTVNTYLNHRPVWSSPAVSFTGDSAVLDTSKLYDSSNSSEYGGKRVVTKKIDMKSFARTEGFQYEISGTGRWRVKSAELLLSAIARHRST